jgi:hypothetical protein
MNLRVTVNNPYSVAATTGVGQTNLFALNGYQIVKVRPNMASDLVIGTIPSLYKDTSNVFVQMPQPQELYVTSDATVFYVSTWDQMFKLTLPQP